MLFDNLCGCVLLATTSQVSCNPLRSMEALRAALPHASSSQCLCCHYVCGRASMIAVVAAVRSANLNRSVL